MEPEFNGPDMTAESAGMCNLVEFEGLDRDEKGGCVRDSGYAQFC